MRVNFELPQIPIADGTPLAGPNGPNDRFKLQIATLEDWRQCLLMARDRFVQGTKSIPKGVTWEEGLALLAVRFLRSGSGPSWPPMGRPVIWSDGEEQQWIDAVFAIADERKP